MATDSRPPGDPHAADAGTHPLAPTRPQVPEHEQPKSLESHPGQSEGAVDDYTHDATVAHEASDVNVRAIVAFIVGLFVLAAVIHVALLGLMALYARQSTAADPAITPLAAPAGTPPPEPRLLTDEPAALQQLRSEEEALLKEIERAKQSVVGRLPARSGGKAPEPSARRAARLDPSSGRAR